MLFRDKNVQLIGLSAANIQKCKEIISNAGGHVTIGRNVKGETQLIVTTSDNKINIQCRVTVKRRRIPVLTVEGLVDSVPVNATNVTITQLATIINVLGKSLKNAAQHDPFILLLEMGLTTRLIADLVRSGHPVVKSSTSKLVKYAQDPDGKIKFTRIRKPVGFRDAQADIRLHSPEVFIEIKTIPDDTDSRVWPVSAFAKDTRLCVQCPRAIAVLVGPNTRQIDSLVATATNLWVATTTVKSELGQRRICIFSSQPQAFAALSIDWTKKHVV